MVICTVILTAVGIFGTCVAIQTLKAINRQALYMLVHAKHFDKLAKAALSNSQATAAQLAEMQKLRDIQDQNFDFAISP